jgi:hypothetical protein
MTRTAPALSKHPCGQHPFRHADCIQSCAEAQVVLNLGQVMTINIVNDQADVPWLRSRAKDANAKHH